MSRIFASSPGWNWIGPNRTQSRAPLICWPMTGSAGAYNAADAAEKRSRYWQEWVRKAESERAELTINTEDGR